MKRKDIAWDALRRRYEAGEGSYRTLGAEYGVSSSCISQKSIAEGWSKPERLKQRRGETGEPWLTAASRQLAAAAQQTIRQKNSEELSVKELKELAGVLKELMALQQTVSGKEEQQEKRIHLVLEGDIRRWSE